MFADSASPVSGGDIEVPFEQLTLDIVISSIRPNARDRDEDYTHVQLRQDTERRIINLHAKVDTGAQTNTIPVRIYRRMYQTYLNSDGFPRKGHLADSGAVL